MTENRENKIQIPPPQENYLVSLGIVRDKLKNRDAADCAQKSGAIWDAENKSVRLNLLGKEFHYKAGEIDVVDPAGGKVELWEKIVIMHYLETARGSPLSGKLISYKEIPDGRLYWPNFISRVHKPLLAAFASKPERMLEIAAMFGGEKSDRGDVSVKIKALPRVDIVYILWRGDDEFAPEAGVVFDERIVDYLPAEDITMISSMTAIKMMKANRSF